MCETLRDVKTSVFFARLRYFPLYIPGFYLLFVNFLIVVYL